MFDIFKTLILVAIFYLLIMFSFSWFNKKEGNFKEVPYVGTFFEIIEETASRASDFSLDIRGFFQKNKDVLEFEKGDWDNFLGDQ